MYKSRLHELAQKRRWDPPIYITGRNGPCHMPRFTATVTVQDQVFGTPAECKSVKEAHNSAARIAFEHFNSLPPVAADGTAPPPAVNSQIPPQITTADTGGSIPVAAPPAEMQPIVDVLLPSPLPSSLPSPPLGLLMKRIDAVIEPANLEVLQENHADTKSSAVSTEPANGEVLKENCEDAQASAANLSVGSHDEGREGLLMKIIDAVIEPANQEVLQENHADTKMSAVIRELANGEVLKENHEDVQASEANLSVGSHDEGREGSAQDQVFKILEEFKTIKEAQNTPSRIAFDHSNVPPQMAVANGSVPPTACTGAPLPIAASPPVAAPLPEMQPVFDLLQPSPLTSSLPSPPPGVYKNRLREFAKKKGLLCPSYETVSSGMSHKPIFVSTVTIGTDTFRGDEEKIKKQAEMNAAKVAYFALTQGNISQNIQPTTANSSMVSTVNESTVAGNISPSIQSTTTIRKCQDTSNEGSDPPPKRAKASPETFENQPWRLWKTVVIPRELDKEATA